MRNEQQDEKKAIDLEPTWSDLFGAMFKSKLEPHEFEQIQVTAKTTDLIRQAQKDDREITFYPDGSYSIRDHVHMRDDAEDEDNE